MLVQGDARHLPLRDGCVQCCVTSPPYWGLRDYGVGGQIGLEATPDEYVATMVAVFREVRRVLRDDGTAWLNLGSSYYGSWGNYGGQNRGAGTQRAINSGSQAVNPAYDGLEQWRPPTAGVSKRRARPCDSSDTGQSDSRLSDSTSFHLCDGCLAALRSDCTSRNDHSPASVLEPSSFASIRERMEFENGHVPTSDCARPADHNSSAILDPQLVQDPVGGQLPASQVSTLAQSFVPRRGVCSHCDNCGGCLSVLGSSYRDARLCGRRADYTRGKDETEQTWRSRMTDMVLSSEAWVYLTTSSLKAKDDVSIPQLVALALRMDGWYLRSDIIWAKPNPMPESVTDRPTRSHEYIFLLAKSERYFYDAESIREEATYGRTERTNWARAINGSLKDSRKGIEAVSVGRCDPSAGRNKRSVWTVNSEPCAEAHFATFPQKLIEPCILAGSRPGDIVLDPFIGSGTTGKVCERLGRRWVGVELSPTYLQIAERRTAQMGIGL